MLHFKSKRRKYMIKETIYDVHWEGPFDWDKRKRHLKKNHVLYQMYGKHLQYGSDALLYIGTTSDMMRRLKEHETWVMNEWENIRIRVGSTGEFSSWKEWRKAKRYPKADEKVVEKIEALLIYAHAPAYNKSNKEDAKKSKGLRIFNSGNFGQLLPEVSYRYFLGK
jgi:hypothetical protein